MNHPRENDLALLAGGEAGRIQRFLLERHVRTCADCRETIAEYRELRSGLADVELPDLNWNFLAADMRANIRLGLEAGACVRSTHGFRWWNPGFAIGCASVVLLVGSGFLLRDLRFHRPAAEDATPVLQFTKSGVEIHTSGNSLTLLNHHGDAAANQTVSAQGDIEARNIDGETGSVTITNVYLQ
jgi:hypothetical protein